MDIFIFIINLSFAHEALQRQSQNKKSNMWQASLETFQQGKADTESNNN